MARLAALLGLATVISQCSAHFLLNHPVTYGFNDDAEGTAPCGGFSVAFDHNVTYFHVDGDSISMTTTHPSTTWLLRAMVGSDTAAANWTNLIPTVQQSGLGDFCQPSVTVPSTFAGNKGVINDFSTNAPPCHSFKDLQPTFLPHARMEPGYRQATLLTQPSPASRPPRLRLRPRPHPPRVEQLPHQVLARLAL
ncbi:hypothetical protein SS1G_03146 [Sclerotinia sclerotiorum 1980 UF-70]|uniref:Copper acquisition factor BIM1-like domain-containing protein n=1 Tax=Sclerotinia sclerotiorum (strain ATCC 18683 / 1980 / Ss-1) TaxID=665079 RepID=A7ECV7_SCLS1|nr:hypothetical protein SS1G_03146 [Sclerotinia sclerotiorum 1980 UF-70]EDO00673.1 hypothetical protein SS1G_03146 [Sclerotinia sclerotiorum 1980 UF-70]